MNISIIIPTLNEEAYLPKLLTSIQRQNFTNYEVIVADAGSTDATVDIAQRFGARIVEGGTPAAGRNAGARIARGEFLFFFDADVQLPKNFLERAYNELHQDYLDFATCEIVPVSTLPLDRLLHTLTNISIRLGQFTTPRVPGFCTLISRRLFNRVGGFDETLALAEDHNLAARAILFRPLRILSSTKIRVSVRRLRKEGRLLLVKKYLQAELHLFFKGDIRDDIINYEFGAYAKKPAQTFLHKTEQHIHKLLARAVRVSRNINETTTRSRKQFGRVRNHITTSTRQVMNRLRFR